MKRSTYPARGPTGYHVRKIAAGQQSTPAERPPDTCVGVMRATASSPCPAQCRGQSGISYCMIYSAPLDDPSDTGASALDCIGPRARGRQFAHARPPGVRLVTASPRRESLTIPFHPMPAQSAAEFLGLHPAMRSPNGGGGKPRRGASGSEASISLDPRHYVYGDPTPSQQLRLSMEWESMRGCGTLALEPGAWPTNGAGGSDRVHEPLTPQLIPSYVCLHLHAYLQCPCPGAPTPKTFLCVGKGLRATPLIWRPSSPPVAMAFWSWSAAIKVPCDPKQTFCGCFESSGCTVMRTWSLRW